MMYWKMFSIATIVKYFAVYYEIHYLSDLILCSLCVPSVTENGGHTHGRVGYDGIE